MNYIIRLIVHANRKILIPLAICFGFSMFVLAAYVNYFDSLQKLDSYQLIMNVRFGRKAVPSPDLVYLAIDRNSYHNDIGADEVADTPILGDFRENFPWSRRVYAEVVERMMQAHAKAVIFDVLCPAPREGDDELRAALRKYSDRVVIGSNFQKEQNVYQGQVGETAVITLPSPSLLVDDEHPAVTGTDRRVGFVNIWPDEDGVIRRAYFSHTLEQESNPKYVPPTKPSETKDVMWSLMARAVQILHLQDRLPNSWSGQLFRYGPQSDLAFPPIPIYQIFIPRIWKNTYRNGEAFHDKVVLVGVYGDWSSDEHRTPYEALMPGPLIHLNILSAVLNKEFLTSSPRWLSYLMICLAGVLAFVETRMIRHPFSRILGGIVTILAVGWGSFLSYNYLNCYLLVMAPIVTFFGGLFLSLAYEVVLEQSERSRMRGVLDRYMSKDLVKDVLDNPHSYFTTVGGVRKPVTILFSDVRGFTTMAEGADPGELVKQLNEYLTEMVKIVFHNKGTIDKFIGDAVMAVWGNVLSDGPKADAIQAVRAALEMREGLARLNADWRQRGIIELSFGIGLNHGEVVVGNVGSDQKMEITVIGDAVNLASRLEGLTKEYRIDLLIGETVAALVEDRFYLQLADTVRVKGKTRPVRVYAVLAEKVAHPREDIESFLQYYHAALDFYQQGHFEHAQPYFEAARGILLPNDLARIYLDRCDQLLANPPEAWDGVFVMTRK